MRDIPALSQHEMDAMDDDFRLRAQCTLAIDKMIADIRNTLKAIGRDKNTYIFFTADNGYHMGEYSFLPGKMTPFDTDINVPLVVVGPGVGAGQTISQIAQTVDLTPTFTDLAGNTGPTAPDGKSLVPLLHPGTTPPVWRQMALIEHHGPPDDPALPDPDIEQHERSSGGANPPDYEALRSNTYLYVEYTNRSPITGVSSTTTEATYHLKNKFIVKGQQVTISGITGAKLAQFNLANQTVTSVSPTQFTIAGTFTATPFTETGGNVTGAKDDGISEHAYYDLDPSSSGYDKYELENIYATLPAATKTTLHNTLTKNKNCSPTTTPDCWGAQK